MPLHRGVGAPRASAVVLPRLDLRRRREGGRCSLSFLMAHGCLEAYFPVPRGIRADLRGGRAGASFALPREGQTRRFALMMSGGRFLAFVVPRRPMRSPRSNHVVQIFQRKSPEPRARTQRDDKPREALPLRLNGEVVLVLQISTVQTLGRLWTGTVLHAVPQRIELRLERPSRRDVKRAVTAARETVLHQQLVPQPHAFFASA